LHPQSSLKIIEGSAGIDNPDTSKAGRRLSILMLTDVYFPRVNGVSTSIQTFVQSLYDAGHHITLVAPDYGEPHNEPFEVVRVPGRKVPTDPEDRLVSIKKMRKICDELCRSRDYDIIHIQTPFVAHLVGVKLAREFNIPVLESYHTFFEEYFYCYVKFLPKRFLKSIARRLSKRQCNKLDSVIVPSIAMSEVLRNYGVGVPINIIPTGMSASDIKPGHGEVFRKKFGIEPDRPMLLFVGRVAHEKNIDFLIQVVNNLRIQYPDILFVIAGEGPAEHHLHSLVKHYSLEKNVRFIGYLSREHELPDCYNAADVFVFSSRTETQGLVLLEAMAQGTPVVALSIMGTRDILEGCDGSIIAREEIDDFKSKVELLLDSPALRKQYSENAVKALDNWHIDVQTDKLVKLYNLLVDNKKQQSASQ
jgi:glycosyltransferase involved in cell wall biosynthesis